MPNPVAFVMAALAAVMAWASPLHAEKSPREVDNAVAVEIGKAAVFWNGRVCPMQTMALDVTQALYGSESYRGMSAEQVLAGWLFFYDDWLADYVEVHPEILDAVLNPKNKEEREALGRLGLVEWLASGEPFRFYPYQDGEGRMEWLSPASELPPGVASARWDSLHGIISEAAGLVEKGANDKACVKLAAFRAAQREAAGDALPSPEKMEWERIFNRWASPLAACLAAAMTAAWVALAPRRRLWTSAVGSAASWCVCLYVGMILASIWWLSGHLPMTNGEETMLLTAWGALTGAVVQKKRALRSAFLGIAAVALGVAAMGARRPGIAGISPMLDHPLLSVHVMLVMASYIGFALMAVLAVYGLSARRPSALGRMAALCRTILRPSVAFLFAGIVVGALWAKDAWGRYWAWDPKETCALITLIVYCVPLFWKSLPERPKLFLIYIAIAVLSVIFTYFGANYFLPGLHSYA